MRRLVVLQRIGNRADHFGVGKHAELDRTDTEIVEAGVDLRAQEGDRRHVPGRPPHAEARCTPCAAKVFRSAWMPAPPPESEPAMVRALTGRVSERDMKLSLAVRRSLPDLRCDKL